MVGLGHNRDEYAYRDETHKLAAWCSDNLPLNTSKTKELVIDFRRQSGTIVERVSTFKYLGAQISEDLCWSANTTAVVKKAQHRLIFKRQHTPRLQTVLSPARGQEIRKIKSTDKQT